MLILTIRTDKPEAEIGLYSNEDQVNYLTWQAHRELSKTIHVKLSEQLASADVSLNDLKGIVVFKGPGSFTGLRIGLSVANALAYSLRIPIVGRTGEDWIDQGIKALKENVNEETVLPEYGALPHITQQKK